MHLEHIEKDNNVSVLEDDKLGFWGTARQNPIAMMWCTYMLFTCIMWGYDGLAAGIVITLPQFRQSYGVPFMGQYVVLAKWQLAFTGGTAAGSLLGGLGAGMSTKYVGERIPLGCAFVISIGGVCAQWFSDGDNALFLAGKLLTGVPLGVFLTVAPLYCSEIAPLATRGAVTAGVSFCISLGQLLAYGVMRQTQTIMGPNSYRIIFAVQWGFSAILFVLLPFLPESPIRLLARGKVDSAKNSIRRLYPVDEEGVQAQIDAIQARLAGDTEAAAHAGSFKDCFIGTNLLRTLSAMGVFFIQNWSGVAWVLGYMGYFMQLGGLKGTTVFNLTVAIAGIMCIGNLAGAFMLQIVGRRSTITNGTIVGLYTMTVCMLIIAVLSIFTSKGQSVVLSQVAFMAIWAFAYQVSIGSAGFAIASEIPTSSLRGVTQSLCTITNGLNSCLWQFVLPYIVNPDEADWGGKVAFVFFGALIALSVAAYFFTPETKGRTFEEIDKLYALRIPPRHFSRTVVNQGGR
ncbi:general substrate transporter [Aureobasidium namibiae CBS 147.97]|uniref:General substrate transporter n=1 Tax=Aureobasidium namibiae CBS 147.97 TaxID=1043004 RepID=A0A074X2X3_9PEZI|nr:general substrate transporter [Aureobasidium namibiae CBS 147.97]KEQ76362.1 general substrate transporter [Aureobasidium namibiae CBS 147.97]